MKLKVVAPMRMQRLLSAFSYDDVGNIARLCKRFGLHDADETPDRSKQMDLQKQVTISPTGKRSSSPGNHIDIPKQMSLFEAVRMWTNDEGIPFDIVDAGNRLTKAQIQEIAHSEAYKAKLLAFDERR